MRLMLVCLAGGVALGWLLPEPDGVAWVVAAFAAGAVTRRGPWRVGLAGLLVLAGATAWHAWDQPPVWSLLGLTAGPVFATAGAWWRDERRGRHILGACALGAVFLAGAAVVALHGGDAAASWVLALLGVALPLVLSRGGRERLMAMAALVPATVVTAMAFLTLAAVATG